MRGQYTDRQRYESQDGRESPDYGSAPHGRSGTPTPTRRGLPASQSYGTLPPPRAEPEPQSRQRHQVGHGEHSQARRPHDAGARVVLVSSREHQEEANTHKRLSQVLYDEAEARPRREARVEYTVPIMYENPAGEPVRQREVLVVEQPRVEQPRVGQHRVEHHRAEQLHAEQPRVRQPRTGFVSKKIPSPQPVDMQSHSHARVPSNHPHHNVQSHADAHYTETWSHENHSRHHDVESHPEEQDHYTHTRSHHQEVQVRFDPEVHYHPAEHYADDDYSSDSGDTDSSELPVTDRYKGHISDSSSSSDSHHLSSNSQDEATLYENGHLRQVTIRSPEPQRESMEPEICQFDDDDIYDEIPEHKTFVPTQELQSRIHEPQPRHPSNQSQVTAMEEAQEVQASIRQHPDPREEYVYQEAQEPVHQHPDPRQAYVYQEPRQEPPGQEFSPQEPVRQPTAGRRKPAPAQLNLDGAFAFAKETAVEKGMRFVDGHVIIDKPKKGRPTVHWEHADELSSQSRHFPDSAKISPLRISKDVGSQKQREDQQREGQSIVENYAEWEWKHSEPGSATHAAGLPKSLTMSQIEEIKLANPFSPLTPFFEPNRTWRNRGKELLGPNGYLENVAIESQKKPVQKKGFLDSVKQKARELVSVLIQTPSKLITH